MQEDKDLATRGAEQSEDPFKEMRDAKPWMDLIDESGKYFETYQEKCDNIDKLYADLDRLSKDTGEREMQIFWANLEVLKPAIYSRPPQPAVVARFKDRKPIVRHAAEILERSLITSFEQEDINETMLGIRDDLATGARGVPWLRFEETEGSAQKVCFDHLDRKDFRHGIARKWKEVPWVARCTFQTKERMKDRFEKDSGDEYQQATYEERKDDDKDNAREKKAAVWELWHKEKRLVVWVSEGCEKVLDIREPILDLNGFFPCPRPAYGTVQRRTLLPVPDFLYYKDQIEEINELTARISSLAESLRLKGFYAGGDGDVAKAVEAALAETDNRAILVPVSNFAAMGGSKLKDSVIWLPVAEVATVIASLVDLRKQLIDDVYQITGISDIMRGSTDANETLGAQQLKSQYGSIRIRDRQQELIRIARDMTRIAAEIMAENFSLQSLMLFSQYDEVPTEQQVQQQLHAIDQKLAEARSNPQLTAQAQQNPQIAHQMLAQAEQQKQQLSQTITFEQVVEFLQSERTRPFSLDIETDSTIEPDEDAQKQRATEFLGALATALSQLAPMVQQQPQSAEFAGEVLKFAVTPFRAGRSLEQAVDSFVDQMKQVAQQPKENPEEKKIQAETQIKMAELQIKQTESQAKLTEAQAKTQTAVQQAQTDLQKTGAEIQKIMAEIERINAQTANVQKPQEAMQ